MEDFTSKKTQIVSGKPVIKKVFRMREGGVVIDNFTRKKGGTTETFDAIPPGSLIVANKDKTISRCPITAQSKYDFSNVQPLGYTIDCVTPEKPQAALMTWGIINPDARETGEPIMNPMEGSDEAFGIGMSYAMLMAFGIVVTYESDNQVLFPFPLPSDGGGTVN